MDLYKTTVVRIIFEKYVYECFGVQQLSLW